MNVNDLWVGDRVMIIRSGKVGTYEGMNGSKARIKYGEKILLVKPKGLTAYNEKPIAKDYEEVEEIKPNYYEEKLAFVPEIDLHIEKLQLSKKHDNPVAILEFQLRKLTEFIDKAVYLKLPKVDIIHGKGTGALRMEVMNIIENYPEKQSIYPINDGGGFTLYLKY